MRLYGILFSMSLATAAWAGAEDSVRIGEQLEEVSVVGFKQDRAALSPVSQSAVGELFIERNQLYGLRDLSAMIANFYMPDYGSRQYSPIYIRGIGSKINSPAVGIYVDGMPYSDRSVLDMDLFGVSKVEVLRGPQGTLFGRNASAGLINVYTYSPLEYQGSAIKASYATYNDLMIAASTYNKLSANFGTAVTAHWHHNDGFLRNDFLRTKADRINNGAIRLGAAWQPAQRWVARYSFSADFTKQLGYPYAVYDAASGTLQSVNYNRESGYRRFVATAGMNWRWTGEKLSFNSQTSFQHSNDKIRSDQDYTAADLYFATVPQHRNMVSQEFTVRSENAKWYHWIAGVFAFAQQENFTAKADYMQPGISREQFNRLPTMGIAAYHVSTFDLFSRLSASIGLRYDFERARADNHTYRAPLNNSTQRTELSNFESRQFSREFTPKFTLKYAFNPSQMVYATVAKGFKAGGFNASIESEADRSYQPEHTWNYELGTKLGFAHGLLSLEASIFYIDWKQQQISITVPALGNIVRNVGHSDSKGAELSLALNPAKGFFVQANYGYTYARMLRAEMGTGRNYSGNMLPLVPRHTLSVNTTYTLYNIGNWLDKLMMNVNITGMGKLYWREDNAVSQPFYSLINLKVAATKGRFTWEIWTKNTTSTNYMAYYFVLTQPMGQKGKPFMLGTTIAYNL